MSLNNLKDIVEIVSLVIAVISIIWTIYSGLRTYKNNSATKKQEHISYAIKQFSDNNYVNKLSALVIITRNINVIFDEMFLVCALENDKIIYRQLEESLCSAGKKTFQKCLKFNYDYLNILCTLRKTSCSNDYIIPWYAIEFFITNRKEFHLDIELSREKIMKEDAIDYDLFIKRAMQYLTLSSSIIACGIKRDKKRIKLNTILMVYANFYKAVIKNSEAAICVFFSCIMRHIDAKKCIVSKSNFIKCNLFDCNISDSSFVSIKISQSNLIQAQIIKCKLEEVEIHNSLMCKAIVIKSQYTDLKNTNVNYNGSKVKDTVLDNCIFKNCCFNGSQFINSRLVNIKFWGIEANKENNLYKNELCGCSFIQCNLAHINFNGAILKSAVFDCCDLENVDFSGADMKNVKFVNCNSFVNINLNGAHNVESIKYIKK